MLDRIFFGVACFFLCVSVLLSFGFNDVRSEAVVEFYRDAEHTELVTTVFLYGEEFDPENYKRYNDLYALETTGEAIFQMFWWTPSLFFTISGMQFVAAYLLKGRNLLRV